MRNAKTQVALVAIVFLSATAVVSAAAVSFNIRDQSQSEIPDYIDDSGQMILEKVPDMVPIASRESNGVAGYSFKEDVYPEEFRPELLLSVEPGGLPDELEAPIPVFATTSGKTIIGYVYTEIGYVSLVEAGAPGFNLAGLETPTEVVETFESDLRP